eukprot:TRINITY_DN2421_c0_g1_i3.p1 TRINITY_DN2421_c0_g1~~TRINITY_DN2421_c0_g1_i3.p1  ORF type:complete len:508 (-),score=90.60 TRINITY_DN2421_c0_g1_i3:32-1519(-)
MQALVEVPLTVDLARHGGGSATARARLLCPCTPSQLRHEAASAAFAQLARARGASSAADADAASLPGWFRVCVHVACGCGTSALREFVKPGTDELAVDKRQRAVVLLTFDNFFAHVLAADTCVLRVTMKDCHGGVAAGRAGNLLLGSASDEIALLSKQPVVVIAPAMLTRKRPATVTLLVSELWRLSQGMKQRHVLECANRTLRCCHPETRADLMCHACCPGGAPVVRLTALDHFPTCDRTAGIEKYTVTATSLCSSSAHHLSTGYVLLCFEFNSFQAVSGPVKLVSRSYGAALSKQKKSAVKRGKPSRGADSCSSLTVVSAARSRTRPSAVVTARSESDEVPRTGASGGLAFGALPWPVPSYGLPNLTPPISVIVSRHSVAYTLPLAVMNAVKSSKNSVPGRLYMHCKLLWRLCSQKALDEAGIPSAGEEVSTFSYDDKHWYAVVVTLFDSVGNAQNAVNNTLGFYTNTTYRNAVDTDLCSSGMCSVLSCANNW